MFLPTIKRQIIAALRHGALDQFQLAAELAEPPFRIRAELQDLKRDQLARACIRERGILWELTNRGERVAWSAEQMELTG